jgi:hypothetical protein
MERDFSDLDVRFKKFFESGERVEVSWKPGFEDYSGYGQRTNGRKSRFWVGRSNGVKPVYLMILTKRSLGGESICSRGVESIRGVGVFKN